MYKQKYLKYKNKYLNLMTQYGAGTLYIKDKDGKTVDTLNEDDARIEDIPNRDLTVFPPYFIRKTSVDNIYTLDHNNVRLPDTYKFELSKHITLKSLPPVVPIVQNIIVIWLRNTESIPVTQSEYDQIKTLSFPQIMTLNNKNDNSVDNKDYFIINSTITNKYLVNKKNTFEINEYSELVLGFFYIGGYYEGRYTLLTTINTYSKTIFINNIKFNISESDIIKINNSFKTPQSITIIYKLYDYLDILIINKVNNSNSDNKYNITSSNNFLFSEGTYTIDIDKDTYTDDIKDEPLSNHLIQYTIPIYITDELGDRKQSIVKYINEDAVNKLRNMRHKHIIQINISNESNLFRNLRDIEEETEEYDVELNDVDYIIKSNTSRHLLPRFDLKYNLHKYTFRLDS